MSEPRSNGLGLSARVSQLKPSATISVANRAKAMKAQGIDVLSFAAGEPDFDTPAQIKKSAIQALESGQTKYMPTLGDPATRQVIADKLTQENEIPGVTADHVGVSAGGKLALYVALQCLIDPPAPSEPTPQVLIPTPAWVSYAPLAQLAGAQVLELPTTVQSGFKITPRQLDDAIGPDARILILNSPSNPCGTMYSPDELKALGNVIANAAADRAPNLIVITDEIYEKIVYADIEHFSIGSIPEIAERTITVNGLSKAFAMTGWRAGYIGASGDFGRRFMKSYSILQGQMTTNITSFVYPAIRTALTQCADDVEHMRKAYARRAVLIHGLVDQFPDVACVKPQGAFYVFPDVSAHFGKTSAGGMPINSALDFAEAVLKEHQVAIVPGDDFGGCGPRHVRISFACGEQQIEQGMARLGDFLASLK